MALYMTDKTGGLVAASYLKFDDQANVFLVQDGLYLSPKLFEGKNVYVLAAEVDERGLNNILPKSYKRVDYGDIIDLIVEQKIISFC